jgi:Fe/S biogenesis protein NfuA
MRRERSNLMIAFTDLARDKIRETVDGAGVECVGIRLRAQKLGRHTFRYMLHLLKTEDLEEGDVIVDAGPFKTHLDPHSAEWTKEAKVDFITGDGGSGFKIDNPAAVPNWEDPVAAKVQKIIDEKLSPGLGEHGGWLELVRVDGDTAYVEFGGGCQGCSGARDTLKNGIEQAITQEVPEIHRVVDETDHAAGGAPYMGE